MMHFFLFFFFDHATWHAGSSFPDQGSNLCPLQWKGGFLTTGPPGKSQEMLHLSNKLPRDAAGPWATL